MSRWTTAILRQRGRDRPGRGSRGPSAPVRQVEVAGAPVEDVDGVLLVRSVDDDSFSLVTLAEVARAVSVDEDIVTVVVGSIDREGSSGANHWSRLGALLDSLRSKGTGRVRLVMSGAGDDQPGRPCVARRIADAWELEVIAPDGTVVIAPGGALFVHGNSRTGSGWWRFAPGQIPRRLGPRTPAPAWQEALGRVPSRTTGGCVVEQIPAGVLMRPAESPRPGLDDLCFAVPVDFERPTVLVGTLHAEDVAADEVAAVLAALPVALRSRARLAPGGRRDVLRLGHSVADMLGSEVEVLTGLPLVAGLAAPGAAPRPILVGTGGEPSWQPFVSAVACVPVDAEGGTPVLRLVESHLPDWLPRGIAPGTVRLTDRWHAAVTRAGLALWEPDSPRPPLAGQAVDPDTCAIEIGAPGQPLDDSLLPALSRLLAGLGAGTRAKTTLLVRGRLRTGEGELRRLASEHGVQGIRYVTGGLSQHSWPAPRRQGAVRPSAVAASARSAAHREGGRAEADPAIGRVIGPAVQEHVRVPATPPMRLSSSPVPTVDTDGAGGVGGVGTAAEELTHASGATSPGRPARRVAGDGGGPAAGPGEDTGAVTAYGSGNPLPGGSRAGGSPDRAGDGESKRYGRARRTASAASADAVVDPEGGPDGGTAVGVPGPVPGRPGTGAGGEGGEGGQGHSRTGDVAPDDPGQNARAPERPVVPRLERLERPVPPRPERPERPVPPRPERPVPPPAVPGSEARAVPLPFGPGHVSGAAERAAFGALAEDVWERHAAAVSRVLTRMPALRGHELEAARTDLVAAHAYLTTEEGPLHHSELIADLRTGEGRLLPYAGCLASALRRLPSYRGAALRGGDAGGPAPTIGSLVREPAPVSAVAGTSAVPAGKPVRYAIWSITGRKVRQLLDEPAGSPRAYEEIVFVPGTAFRVLGVRNLPSGSPVVLLRELPGNAALYMDGEAELSPLDLKALAHLEAALAKGLSVGGSRNWPPRCSGPVGHGG